MTSWLSYCDLLASICLLLFKLLCKALFDTTSSICCMYSSLSFEVLCLYSSWHSAVSEGEVKPGFVGGFGGEVLLGNLSVPRKLFFFNFFFLMRHAQGYCSETVEQERCDKTPYLIIFRHCKAIPYTFAMGFSC